MRAAIRITSATRKRPLTSGAGRGGGSVWKIDGGVTLPGGGIDDARIPGGVPIGTMLIGWRGPGATLIVGEGNDSTAGIAKNERTAIARASQRDM